MRFMPADRTCCSMAASAPVPSAIIVNTAATPIVIPSMVSAVCSLLRPSAFSAIRKLDGMCTVDLFGCASRYVRLIGHDQTVLEPDDPRAVLRDLLLVRDQDNRNPALLLQPLEDVHD